MPDQGIVIDTSAFIEAERKGGTPELGNWATGADLCLASITVSELLVAVHRATDDKWRARRTAFVEHVLGRFTVLNLTVEVARVHARLGADLRANGTPIGAHDLIIAATASCHGLAVLTKNVREFSLVPGLKVIAVG